jgi:uncharacterized protein (DUF1800 family)
MGRYLNMVINMPDPTRGTNPNENYARELMQLFLHRVCSSTRRPAVVDAAGEPVPHLPGHGGGHRAVFTGWTYPHPARRHRQPTTRSYLG